MKQSGFASFMMLILVASLSVLSYMTYKYDGDLRRVAGLPTPTPTPGPATEKRTYISKSLDYSIDYPASLKIGIVDSVKGEFRSVTGNDLNVTIMPFNESEYNNFLQIQVGDAVTLGVPILNAVKEEYGRNKKHPKTTKISPIKNTYFLGYPAYEYVLSGEALHTGSWDGSVVKGEYKAIIFQKGDNLFSIYLKNTTEYNKILATFKFSK